MASSTLLSGHSSRASLQVPRPLALLAVFLGVTGPSISYFTEYCPPLLPLSAIATTAVSLIIALLVRSWRHHGTRSRSTLRAILLSIIGSIACMALYVVLFQFTTVSPRTPGRPLLSPEREQIGFYLSSWSLTEEGREDLRLVTGQAAPKDLMLLNAWPPPERLWQPWTIAVAGLFLVALFGMGSLLWTYAFAELLAVRDDSQRRDDAI